MTKILYIDNIKWLSDLVKNQKRELNKKGITDEEICKKLENILFCPNCGSHEISKDKYALYPLYYCDKCFYKWRSKS